MRKSVSGGRASIAARRSLFGGRSSIVEQPADAPKPRNGKQLWAKGNTKIRMAGALAAAAKEAKEKDEAAAVAAAAAASSSPPPSPSIPSVTPAPASASRSSLALGADDSLAAARRPGIFEKSHVQLEFNVRESHFLIIREMEMFRQKNLSEKEQEQKVHFAHCDFFLQDGYVRDMKEWNKVWTVESHAHHQGVAAGAVGGGAGSVAREDTAGSGSFSFVQEGSIYSKFVCVLLCTTISSCTAVVLLGRARVEQVSIDCLE